MRLHLLGLPHTVTNEAHSHCAFTGKVFKFPAMMRLVDGYEVIHYGVEGAETAAHEHVTILARAEQNRLRGHDGSNPSKFYSDDANIGTPLYRFFNRRLNQVLKERVQPGDLVLMPFGHGHGEAVEGLNPQQLVESGIGYGTLFNGAPFKIFESYAWMHWHQGKENRSGKNYEWVIPNYFDIGQWDVNPEPDPDRVVFLGRICDAKGLRTVVEIAKYRPDLHFTICGQGDPTPYLGPPNLEYQSPLEGRARSAYLGNARACLMPTEFTEPFGGVAVEAMLCGTPVLSTPFGAFTETIRDEETGFRCHTLGDFLVALDKAIELDRVYIADRARLLYGFPRIAKMYDRVFQQIADLSGRGWYSPRSFFSHGKVAA